MKLLLSRLEMKISLFIVASLMLFHASAAATRPLVTTKAQDEALVTETLFLKGQLRLCLDCHPSNFELFLLARRLLSERGMIEVDTRGKTLTVTDRPPMIESIRTLVTFYSDLESSVPTELKNPGDRESAAAIRAVLDAQVATWNRGDLEGYMDGYQRSPDIVFISGDRLTRGWQTVLERYKRSYDTREKMGVLTFSDVEITILGKEAALVFGRWQLRAKDEPRGRFTLLFKKTKNGWRIVHDHTSSA